MLATLMVLQDDGLTIAEVIRDMPHDAGALIVYALVAGFVIMIWRGSRKAAGNGDGQTGA
jgi:hypothetical protein